MIVRDKKLISASLCSGAQKFITDLALRLTLTKLHPFNPAILLIDEGFGRLDSEHLNNIHEFLSQLHSSVKMVFITHIDSLKDIADPICIQSTLGVSQVVF